MRNVRQVRYLLRYGIAKLSAACAVALTVAFCAVIVTPQTVAAAPLPASLHQTSAASPSAGHSALRILPGQTVVIAHPLPQDPKATLRITLSKATGTAHFRVMGATGAVATASVTCIYGIRETETAYNVYGSAIYWYAITINFCYNGGAVTSQSSPPTENWWTCCFWGLSSHHASTSGVNSYYGVSHGCGYFSGPLWQSDTLWTSIDTYGDGSYYGGGGYGSC